MNIELLFNKMILSLKDFSVRYRPITENIASITNNPFYEVDSVDRLKQIKEGKYPEELKELYQAIIKSKVGKQALEYFILMTPLDFVSGSKKSIKFLQALYEKATELN
jgi:hypothetical protein